MESVQQQRYSGYKGNSVFQNQPPHTYFNKSFDDPTDVLFQQFNEIHPHFLSEEELEKNSNLVATQKLIDPRNNHPIERLLIDTTKRQPPKIFKTFLHKSKLSKEQHRVCLRVVQALKTQDEILESDLLLYRRTEMKRQLERIEFLKFIHEYGQSHRESIYAPVNRLVVLYKNWYCSKVQLLRSLIQDVSYNTHTGLPHVNACDRDEQNVKVVDVQVLERNGFLPLWDNETIDLTKLSKSVETFSALCAEAAGKPDENNKLQIKDGVNFNIPLDALLFLMTAGDYPDLPTEILLDIKNDGENELLIAFHTTLPARNCGWHTNANVVEQAFHASQNLCPLKRGFHFDHNHTAFILYPKEIKEISAGLGSIERKYEPQPFDDYIKKMIAEFKDTKSDVRPCQAMVEWKLKDMDTAEEIRISTVLQQPPAIDENAEKFLGGFTIKLEYKPQFGCEVMTKYELLKEWITLRLLASSRSDAALKRLRVSAVNFEPLLSELLVISQIEHELSTVYSVNISHMLSGLYNFLKMLERIPSGEYMLRFNAKFRDKLMLCAPSQELTQNTIFLHSLLQAEPNDLAFMTQNQFLPISSNLCSAMHLHHKVLPCAFTPGKSVQRQISKFKVLNDREFVLTKLQKKSNILSAKQSHHKKRVKYSQKSKRRSRLRAEKQKKQSGEEEIQKEIELDKLLFGLE